MKLVYGDGQSMSVSTESVELVGDETVKNVARAAVFAAITAATAPLAIKHPMVGTVPLTLQTLWVYLGGVVLGPVWGGAAFLLYAVAGIVGLPVFAEGASGLGVVLGPTGGYIVGFVVGAAVIGYLVHGGTALRDPGEVPTARVVAALVVGSAVVWGLGGVGLMVFAGYDVPAVLALTSTFLLTGAVKVAATVGIVNGDAVVAR